VQEKEGRASAIAVFHIGKRDAGIETDLARLVRRTHGRVVVANSARFVCHVSVRR
jgi:hypothetical protein